MIKFYLVGTVTSFNGGSNIGFTIITPLLHSLLHTTATLQHSTPLLHYLLHTTPPLHSPLHTTLPATQHTATTLPATHHTASTLPTAHHTAATLPATYRQYTPCMLHTTPRLHSLLHRCYTHIIQTSILIAVQCNSCAAQWLCSAIVV